MGKRALIVDDSKSARLFLARILEQHAIQVDTAESAEQAIEYLGSNRPDAIFMDHMMPGMDGLQAVQAIKNNPRTATIPIMMYTSQEGELYVGQARALGAIGVLPKEVKPADVMKVLYQLNLVADRRSAEQLSTRAAAEASNAAVDTIHSSTHPLAQPDGTVHAEALREQLTELRRAVLAGFDSQGDRLLADMRTALQDHRAHPIAALPPPPRHARLPWALTVVMAGACALFAMLYWQQDLRLSSVAEELARLKSAPGAVVSPLPAAPPAGLAEVTSPSPTDASSEPTAPVDAAAPDALTAAPARGSPKLSIQTVPYGVEPFSGSRLDAIRQLFDRLADQGFQGNVEIRTYTGRFCLVGNAVDGYSLAPDDLAYSKCDMVSPGRDDPAASATHIPVVMADLVGTLRANSHDQVHVQINPGDGSNLAPYPVPSDALTAGEWNRAAAINNRIEIRVR